MRLQTPETIDKALNMAVIATNAEREGKASVTDDRGMSARVYAVGCSREVGGSSRFETPGKNTMEWISRCRVPA